MTKDEPNRVTARMVEAALTELWMGGMRDVPDGVVRAAIEAALKEQPAPEPVAWAYQTATGFRTIHWLDRCDLRQLENDQKAAQEYPSGHRVWPLYAHPPQRKPLTEEEIAKITIELAASHQHSDVQFARAIEQAHGIGGEE